MMAGTVFRCSIERATAGWLRPAALVQGNAAARDIRLGELLIAKRIKLASAQLVAVDFKFKALLAA
jgi:hypothetical protein